MNDEKPRQIAAQILHDRARGAVFVEDLLETRLAGHPLKPADRALCQELVCGVVRWQATLDWLIARQTAGRTQKPWLQVLLQLGLYQMFWLDRIPNHAAVNETVELARRFGFGPQAGFVNALLRGYARRRDATERMLVELKAGDPSLGHSHPAWLYQRWLARWGAADSARLMEWNNRPPPAFARVNTLKTTVADLTRQWQTEGVRHSEFQRDWLGDVAVFRLESYPPLGGLASLKSGLFYIQDPGTLLAVRELDPQPGEAVLDACAAPGGKTTLIAQYMRNQGRLVARDNAPDRLELLRENCDRLGATCVSAEIAPGTESGREELKRPTGRAPQLFDRILIDAPCSNTGVMRRRVDLRWRLRPAEISRLLESQMNLLRECAPLLKPGGTLVYSTCSLEPDENESVVAEFLASHSGYAQVRSRELLPFTDEVDGAFVARLVRK